MSPSSWKNIFRDLASVYSSRQHDETHPVKKADGMSAKFITILAFVVFLAVVILSLFLAVLCKWISSSKRKNKDETSDTKAKPKKTKARHRSPKSQPPRHVNLMRSDSSLSEIDVVGRDSSLSSTPLSPLSEENSSMFPFERGRLEFSVTYEPENECLKVTVVQGHGLPQRHCIFYVEVLLLPDMTTTHKTSIRYHNPSPIFEETLGFFLPYPELPERTLCLKVCELDGFSQQNLIGSVLYSFEVENWNYITNPMKMNLELSGDLPQDGTNQEHVGEVLMSLCYLPTAGRLTLVILKCCLFKASLLKGLPSPFIKVSLMLNRKQVKKIKTSVKSKTLNPVYNEAFIFDVPAQHIGNVNLYTRVVNDRENQQVMGKVIIGPNAKCIMGVHHWERMLLSPRKPLAQWHMIT